METPFIRVITRTFPYVPFPKKGGPVACLCQVLGDDYLRLRQCMAVACFQVLVTMPLERIPFRHLMGHVSRTVSLKAEGTDQIMISGGWRGSWDAETREGAALPDSISGNVAEAIAVVPALEGLEVAVADASHQESVSVDGVPIIDTVPGIDNLLFATGWCGHGWAIAPVIAERLSDWVQTGQRDAQLEPFALARFNR